MNWEIQIVFMNYLSRQSVRFGAMVALVLMGNSSFAEDISLIRIGPRVGLSVQTFMGKDQAYNFQLYDLAAVFRLPWRWPLAEAGWKIETRLLASAGVITGASERGLMATIVPTVALTSPTGTFMVDAGAGAGLFSNYQFGRQNFGGPAQIIATTSIGINVRPHAYVGFRVQHFSDARIYGQSSLGVDMYLLEVGYKF